MRKDTGGTAFPVPFVSQNNSTGETTMFQSEGGMTLRDYFAAKALAGGVCFEQEDGCIRTPEDAAQLAYRFADAMLAERAK